MFVTEGPVDPESRLFIGRQAELVQMEAWLTAVRCVGAVVGARQTGKTSLLLRLRHLLQRKYAFVFIDLEAVAGAGLVDCVSYIASEMTDQLAAQVGRIDVEVPRKTHEFLGFLERCARAVPGVRIVVLLDEIGALLPETSLRLTSAIRAVFTTRLVKPEFGRYVFIVAGATDMLDLAIGQNSPLKNVTETLYVEDLSRMETERLVGEMFDGQSPASHANLSGAVHRWTNGHPYWTQRVGEALYQHDADLTEDAIDGAVKQLLQTEDKNLPHVFRALDADRTLRDLLTALVGGTPITFSRANQEIARLELIGLLKNEGGLCAIRNRIYQEVLERQPVQRMRPPVRDLHQFTDLLLHATDLDALLQAVALYLQEGLQNLSVSVLRHHADDGALAVVSSVGVEAARGISVRVDPHSSRLSAVVAPTAPESLDLSDVEAELLTKLGTALIVPVRGRERSEAFLCLGRKLSGHPFDPVDHELIAAVTEQAEVCIDRLRLRSLERDAYNAWLIQRQLLPQVLPQVAGFQFAGSCRPARVVGGDYYDAFHVADNVIALCVGDVVGKGMPAAILMGGLQSAVKALSSATMSPGALCRRINDLMVENTGPAEFITFFYALVDTATRELVYTNAGHNPPILLRASSDVARLGEGGPMLGFFRHHEYPEESLTLQPGDKLLLFTDGVTEVCNADGEEFGDDRLTAIVRASSDATALQQKVIEAVTIFSGGNFSDDVTVLALTC